MKYRAYGYDEVITPQIFDVELWKRSGHYDNYRDDMFFADAFDEVEERSVERQADELSVALSALRWPGPLLPRAAAADRRFRSAPPLRAFGGGDRA